VPGNHTSAEVDERTNSGRSSEADRRPAAAVSALRDCDESVGYYAWNAKINRRWYRFVEVALVVVGASISLVALVVPNNGLPAAVLGGLVVVLTGLRKIFHWDENYIRFTEACSALVAARRQYRVGSPPYQDPGTRDHELVKVINMVEERETRGWVEIMQQAARGTQDKPAAR
jgi:hypothetical protein